ncbi:hypothetical protein Bhyg_02011 [Pseudolycoriella hygida]|uniref:Uncharacterized protein n=1 Tax=Pseudolycoriella hygida TaxID=35572 RepID=A0A9Q0NBA6_9DIPT|nr:hypothetical protein Bhyg_02011 [Pseudolycoriella hygida]
MNREDVECGTLSLNLSCVTSGASVVFRQYKFQRDIATYYVKLVCRQYLHRRNSLPSEHTSSSAGRIIIPTHLNNIIFI